MAKSRNVRRKVKKKRRIKVFVMTFLLIILGGGSYFAYDLFSNVNKAADNIYEEIDKSKLSNYRTDEVKVSDEPFNILLVGLEEQGGGQRSDVLMLVTVNPKTEEIYMLSIPRDTRTYVPELGYNTKINHSYGNGGIESTIETVSELFDVPIDFYVTTNFEGFEDIVDTLGGVTVDVPFTFKAQLTESLRWKTFYEGEMDLNGNEALAYVRMRKKDPNGDMGRNERQQQVIKAIVDKGSSFSTITKVNDIMEDLGENVRTNIPPSKFLNFIQLYSKIKDSQIERLALEGTDEWLQDIYYYIPDEDSVDQISSTLNNVLEMDGYSSTNKHTASEDTDY